MKILYGVQGTGNGHISRASAMAEAFKAWPELQLTWLLSGRDPKLGCGAITAFDWRKGLTFVCRDGRVRMLPTLRSNNVLRFYRDFSTLDLKPYDLVITDYEPVLAHAARKRGVPIIGIGHQYAFNFDVPTRGGNPLVKAVMRNFAPVTTAIGLHWHHFGFPILPPIIDLQIPAQLPPPRTNKIIVYLPFENPRMVVDLLRPFHDFEFYVYHPALGDDDAGHLHARAISRTGFRADLLDAHGVITNSGFELISESLRLGKKILTTPLGGQMEQQSNAAALNHLGYATVAYKLEFMALANWLTNAAPTTTIRYPDVAATLARWIAGGAQASAAQLSEQLWRDTSVE